MTISESGLEAEKPAKGLHYQGYVEPDRTKGGVRLRSTTGHHILHSILVATLIVPFTHSTFAHGRTQGVQNPGLGAGLNQTAPPQPNTDNTGAARIDAQSRTNQQKIDAQNAVAAAQARDAERAREHARAVRQAFRRYEQALEVAKEKFAETQTTFFKEIASLSDRNAALPNISAFNESVLPRYSDPKNPIVPMAPSRVGPFFSAAAIADLPTVQEVAAKGTPGRQAPPRALRPDEFPSHFKSHIPQVIANGSMFIGQEKAAGRTPAEIAAFKKDLAARILAEGGDAAKKRGITEPIVSAVIDASDVDEFNGHFTATKTALLDRSKAEVERQRLSASLLGGEDHKFFTDDGAATQVSKDLVGAVRKKMLEDTIAFQGEMVVAIGEKAEAGIKESEKLERAAEELRKEAEELQNNPPPSEAENTPGPEDVPEAPGGGGDEGGEQAGAGGGQGGGGGGGDGQGGGGSGGTGGGIPFGGSPPGFQGPRAPGEAVANPTAANKQDYRGLTKAEIGNQDLNLPTLPASQRPVRAAQRPARQLASLGGIPDLGDRSTPGGVTPPGGNGFLGGGGGGNQPQSFGAGGGVGGQFQGDPFRFASPYGRRGAKLKAPITVAYGSGSANSGGSSAGTINTGAGSSSAASKQILQGAGGRGAANGVFGVFGANNILQKACKNSERRARIGKMCREARRITVTVAEAEPERKPASSKPAGKTSKQIASPDITL